MADFYGIAMEALMDTLQYEEEAKIAALAQQTVPLAADIGVAFPSFLTAYAVIGVFMALGSGYRAATEEVRNENSMAGFTQGFVMGLLGWSWQSAVNHFGRFFVVRISNTNSGDDVVRVNAYNRGLKGGYMYASAFPESVRKPLAQKLHKMARPQIGDWTENDKISYVIDLAGALKRVNNL